MTKPNIKEIAKTVKAFSTKHSPEILTGFGIAGMITTTILAVKATPKALQKIDDAEYEKGENLTKGEVIKATWKCYIPAVVTGTTSTICLIGASSMNLKRNAALATAYKISETALREYKEKVVETIGEKKEKTIREKIHQDKLEKTPVTTSNVIITGKGKSLCFDALFSQYFESDLETIKKAVNDLNYRMLAEQYVSVNDLYDELGIDRMEIGDMLGWNISKHGMIEITVDTQMSKDGRPCIVLDYNVAPDYAYDRSY